MTLTSLEIVENCEKGLQDLRSRMDADSKLAYLDKYTLRFANGHEVPDAISVTMNDPAVFLNAVVSWIMSAKWQTVVEGKISDKQKHKVENFLDDKDAQADEYLSKRKFRKLLSHLASHVCARGWIGARRIWQVEQEKVWLEVVPIDMRWAVWEMGDELKWLAYRTWRTREQVDADYPDLGLNKDIQEVQVLDYWDDKKEEVWIDSKLVKTNKHTIGYPPFVIKAAPEGFMLLDKGYMVHEGESIFFLDRGLYGEYNRIMSIDQSLAMLALQPPYQRATTDEVESPYPSGPGKVYDVQKEEEYQIVPQPDINMANRVVNTEIAGALQRGGVNNIDLGNSPQPVTAILINTETEIRNKILSPRLQCMEEFFTESSRMDIQQFQANKLQGKIGRYGRQHDYSGDDLGDPETYTISYEGMSRSKRQEIANLVMFENAKSLSMKTRLTDILMVDDPEGEMNRIDAERAEQADPFLFFSRKACSLFDEVNDLTGEEKQEKLVEANRMAAKAMEAMVQSVQQSVQMPQQTGSNPAAMALLSGPNNGLGVQ